jgi:hypothetical protein
MTCSYFSTDIPVISLRQEGFFAVCVRFSRQFQRVRVERRGRIRQPFGLWGTRPTRASLCRGFTPDGRGTWQTAAAGCMALHTACRPTVGPRPKSSCFFHLPRRDINLLFTSPARSRNDRFCPQRRQPENVVGRENAF